MAEAAGKDYIQELKLVERKGELDANNAFLQKILDGISKEQSDEARISATQAQSQTQTMNEVLKQVGPMLQQAMSGGQQAPMRQPTQGMPTPQPNQLPTADQSGPITGVPTDFVAQMRAKRGDLGAIKEQLKAAASRSAMSFAGGARNSYNIKMYEALQKESGLTKDEIDTIAKESGISQGEQRIKLSERQLMMLEREYDRKAAREPFDDTVKIIDTVSKDAENPGLVRREMLRKATEYAINNKKEPTRDDLLRIAGELPKEILVGKPAKPSAALEKYSVLKMQGMDDDTALGLAYGLIDRAVDPITGDMYLVDKRTNTKKKVGGGPEIQIPRKTKNELTEQNAMIDSLSVQLPTIREAVKKGVGAYPMLKEFAGKIFGQLPDGSFKLPFTDVEVGTGRAAVSPEITEARNTIRLFRESMLEAFRVGRMPLQQQKRLLEIFDQIGPISSTPDAEAAIKSIEDYLKTIKDTNNRIMGGGSMGTSDNPHNPTTQEEYDAIQKGAYFINPKDGKVKQK